VPKTKRKLGSLDDADPELLKTFLKLGISLNEQEMLTNVAVDAVFDLIVFQLGLLLKSKFKNQELFFVPLPRLLKNTPLW